MQIQSTLKLLAITILTIGSANAGRAADLGQATLRAWNSYVAAVDLNAQERLRSGQNFLWIDQSPGRLEQVRRGQILVSPAGAQTPKKIHNGLIHHWLGASFIHDATLPDVLAVIRNYDRYKDIYGPAVIDSKLVSKSTDEDRFSMLLMNRALFMKTALDADYVSFSKLEGLRFCSISRTTRVQEVENFGQNGEHKLPEGEGTGVIWRLFSVVRLEQRDRGVYLETEAVALSRDIPLPLRLFVDPIVRRVASSSMTVSLRQTAKAVQYKGESVARVPSQPVDSNSASGLSWQSLLPR